MSNESTVENIQITEEMISRGLEFFAYFSIDARATETGYPDFVSDFLNFALHGKAPWPGTAEKALALVETP